MPVPNALQTHRTPMVRRTAGMAGAPLDASVGLSYSLNFTASTHKVQTGTPIAIPSGQSARTLAAWIKPTAVSTVPGIIDLNASSGQSFSFESTNTSNNLCFSDSVNAGNNFSLTAGQKPALGVWSFVCLSFDGGTTLAYYQNGSLVTTKTTGVTINTGPLAAVGVGLRINAPAAFNGLIAAPRIWNRALSAAEIQTLYLSGTPPANGLVGEWLFAEGGGLTVLDTSGQGNTGTITGAAWSADVPTF